MPVGSGGVMVISWFSAGVSSAVATKLALKKHPDMRIIYTHIDDQHPDTMRFIHDCEKWFGREVEITQSPLKSVDAACRKAGFINSPNGAACTRLLKRRVRTDWERENGKDHIYVWGMDYAEKDRADRLNVSMPYAKHDFPLIDRMIDKDAAHGIIEKAGIKRPVMYDIGYPNNNCVGCVKAGIGYWVKIKKDFPDVFESRCKMEDVIGGRIFKDFSLRDIDETRGRIEPVIVPDCGIMCEIMIS
jgi:3'-phosphoadenosine 5'-phosphosulfate sulfotransferase (PAPS reductase)/FAD synthetase